MFARGITLLELLVVLAIVGVVAALALPAWQHYLRRTNRTEATTSLYQLVSAEERFHLRHGRFTADISSAPPDGLGLRDVTESGRYVLSVSLSQDAQTFVATATPARGGGQASDMECQAFHLDHRGRRGGSGGGDVTRGCR
jgi:type IV pilus assembly protein PilE